MVADALSRRFVLVNTFVSRIMGFEILKGLYSMNSEFKDTFDILTKGNRLDRYQLIDGFFQRRSSMSAHELIERVICQGGS